MENHWRTWSTASRPSVAIDDQDKTWTYSTGTPQPRQGRKGVAQRPKNDPIYLQALGVYDPPPPIPTSFFVQSRKREKSAANPDRRLKPTGMRYSYTSVKSGKSDKTMLTKTSWVQFVEPESADPPPVYHRFPSPPPQEVKRHGPPPQHRTAPRPSRHTRRPPSHQSSSALPPSRHVHSPTPMKSPVPPPPQADPVKEFRPISASMPPTSPPPPPTDFRWPSAVLPQSKAPSSVPAPPSVARTTRSATARNITFADSPLEEGTGRRRGETRSAAASRKERRASRSHMRSKSTSEVQEKDRQSKPRSHTRSLSHSGSQPQEKEKDRTQRRSTSHRSRSSHHSSAESDKPSAESEKVRQPPSRPRPVRSPSDPRVDEVDELDGTDPFGLNWHHHGPYEAASPTSEATVNAKRNAGEKGMAGVGTWGTSTKLKAMPPHNHTMSTSYTMSTFEYDLHSSYARPFPPPPQGPVPHSVHIPTRPLYVHLPRPIHASPSRPTSPTWSAKTPSSRSSRSRSVAHSRATSIADAMEAAGTMMFDPSKSTKSMSLRPKPMNGKLRKRASFNPPRRPPSPEDDAFEEMEKNETKEKNKEEKKPKERGRSQSLSRPILCKTTTKQPKERPGEFLRIDTVLDDPVPVVTDNEDNYLPRERGRSRVRRFGGFLC